MWYSARVRVRFVLKSCLAKTVLTYLLILPEIFFFNLDSLVRKIVKKFYEEISLNENCGKKFANFTL